MRHANSARALLVASAILAAAASAPAAVVLTTAVGSGADTYVSNDSNKSATTTLGTLGSAEIRRSDTSRAKAVYLRFDLSGVSGDLSGATLSLHFTNANRNRTMNIYGLTDETGDAWDESTIDYANAPGILQPADGGAAYNSGVASLDSSKLSLLTTFTTPSSNGSDVTTAPSATLDSFLASDTDKLVTLVLYTASSDTSQDFYIATKENTGGYAFPTLTLPNAAVPEPASLSLLGLGALGFLRRRR